MKDDRSYLFRREGELKKALLKLGAAASSDGQLHFDRALMHDGEFLTEPATFDYFDVQQQKKSVALTPGSLARAFSSSRKFLMPV